MTTTYSISKTQYQILAAKEQQVALAQASLKDAYAMLLAAHDLTGGSIVSATETTITVEIPDSAPVSEVSP